MRNLLGKVYKKGPSFTKSIITRHDFNGARFIMIRISSLISEIIWMFTFWFYSDVSDVVLIDPLVENLLTVDGGTWAQFWSVYVRYNLIPTFDRHIFNTVCFYISFLPNIYFFRIIIIRNYRQCCHFLHLAEIFF